MSVLTDPEESGSRRPTNDLRLASNVLVKHSTEGLAILDAQRRFLFVNPAGAEILRSSPEDLTDTPADMFEVPEPGPGGNSYRAVLPGAGGSRLVDVTETASDDLVYIAFRDRTEEFRREKHFTAFVQTASSVATASDNESLLGEIATCVLDASGQAACTLVLFDDHHGSVKQVGTAGGYPDDYAERLTECIQRGAPLASLGAFSSQRPLVAPGWCDRVLDDDRWAPVHDILRAHRWGTLVAVPLKSVTRTIGSITLFYRSGQEPEARDVDFLSTIGEMAAVAIVNHELAARMARKSALEERHRIARDLHDSVSQTMFGISMRSRALQLAAEGATAEPKHLADGLGQLHQLSVDALADMREMIHHLRPEALETVGLIQLVRRHATSLAAQHEIETTVSSNVDNLDLPYPDQLELLRIAQEAMANAARHSGAGLLEVTFWSDSDLVRIQITDDGTGFIRDEKPSGHFGLKTMAERASSLGATLTIESRPGRTEVSVMVPRREGSGV